MLIKYVLSSRNPEHGIQQFLSSGGETSKPLDVLYDQVKKFAIGYGEDADVIYAILSVILPMQITVPHRPRPLLFFSAMIIASSVKPENRYKARLAHFTRCYTKTAIALSVPFIHLCLIICRGYWRADLQCAVAECMCSCFEYRSRRCTAASVSPSVNWGTRTVSTETYPTLPPGTHSPSLGCSNTAHSSDSLISRSLTWRRSMRKSSRRFRACSDCRKQCFG